MNTIKNFAAKPGLILLFLLASVLNGFSGFTTNTTDLAVGQFLPSTTLTNGQPFTVSLLLTNNGPSPVLAPLIVYEQLPPGFGYVTSSGNGTYNPSANTWTVTPGAPGTTNVLYLTLVPLANGLFTNTIFFFPSGFVDPNPLNNTSSVPIMVISNTLTPVQINCPSNITASAAGTNGSTVFFTVTAGGGCSSPTVVCFPPSGSTFPVGTTTVHCSAYDACSNTNTCSFTVTVTNTPITINCSSNITTAASGTNGSVVFFSVTASGGCSTPSVICNPPSGSSFPVGTTTVYCSAYDYCGQSNTCSFTVTVTNTAITINCSSNITAAASSTNGSVVFFSVTASGGCSTPSVICNPPSGSSFPVGTTTVYCSAYDYCGQTNTCSFTVTVTNAVTNADLQITKLASTNSVKQGQEVVFTLSLKNLGPANVTNPIIVTDCLPAGFIYVTDSTVGNSSSGFYSAGTCWWTYTAGLASNATATLTITALATNVGVWTNTATIEVPTGINDTNLSNNTSSAVVTVTSSSTQSDLMVIKTSSTNLAKVGQQVVFTVFLTNLGPSYISNTIVVTDCLPSGFLYITDNTYGTNINGQYSPGSCYWTWTAGLATNTLAMLRITTLATNIGVYTNTATIEVPTGVTDTNLNNNSSSVVVTNVLPKADLQITKTVSSTNLQIGQQAVFTITLQNLGPDNVTNPVVVSDCLPTGLQYVTDSTVGHGAQSVYSAGTCLWTIPGGIATNTPLMLTITTLATTNVCYTNTASVAVPAGYTDPNTNNNTASVQSCINTLYAINGSVRNCQSNGPVLPQITVTLTGPTNRVAVTDTNGNFSFSNLYAGAYMVTPQQTGNIFAPPAAAITLNGNTNLPAFLGGVPIIYGSVNYISNTGPAVSNITVTLKGGTLAMPRISITDMSGKYIFTNPPPGAYTVTPIPTNGYVFLAPTNAMVTITATNCSTNVNFIATNRTVQMIAMEVIQVIQDWSNSVPLTAAKSTFVRVHLHLPPTNNGPVLLQNARLYGTNNGAALPGSPLSPVNTNGMLWVKTTNAAADAYRKVWTNSFDFQIPMSWTTNSITLAFSCTNNVTVSNVAPVGGGGTNGMVTVSFVPCVIPNIKIYGFNWTNGGPDVFQTIDMPSYRDLPGRFTSIYPIPDASTAFMTRKSLPPTTLAVPKAIPAFLSGVKAIEDLADLALVYSNGKLIQIQAFDQIASRIFGGGTNWLYYAAIAAPSPGTYGWAGAFISSTDTYRTDGTSVSSGFLETNFYGKVRQTPPHEVGHNLGLGHTFDNGGADYPYNFNFPAVTGANKSRPAIGPMDKGTNALIYGLCTLTLRTAYPSNNINPIPSPFFYFDMMSYSRDFVNSPAPDNAPLERWMSPYTYAFVRSNLNKLFTNVVAPAPGPMTNWFYVRGVVDYLNTNGALFPLWKIKTALTPPPAPAGTYSIRILNAVSNIIRTIPFAPKDFDIEEGEVNEPTAGMFVVPVEEDPSMYEMQVWDDANNVMLSDIKATPYSPTVSNVLLQNTNGGSFTGTGMLDVHWQGYDPDPNAHLSYTVQYSPDGGASWDTLDVDDSGTEYDIDSSYLSSTTQGMIRVMATDGFHVSDPATSATFTIPNHAPTASITSPLEGTVFSADQRLFLDVIANDPQDGLLDGSSVQWSSSLNGVLGYGAELNFETDTLKEGKHTITVTATDSASLNASASVDIFVLHLPPPELSIQLVGTNALLSWPVVYTNYVLESTVKLQPTTWTAVGTAPVPMDSIQTVTVPVSRTNSMFFHLRMP